MYIINSFDTSIYKVNQTSLHEISFSYKYKGVQRHSSAIIAKATGQEGKSCAFEVEVTQSTQMLLFLLLSLALTSPANCWTNGTTVEYWVRPDTMSECPHSIPQHQCVTITDLVTNSTNTSINGGMSINVFFIAGTHVPKTDGWIIVGNPYLDQKVSANFTAISNRQNQNAIIACESGHTISFVFFQLRSLTLKKNIELQNCGLKISFKKQFNGPQSLNESTSSVVVMNVPQLVIANINITSSRGAGMIIILTDSHNSNMVTLNEIVIHGSNHTGNTMFGSNLYLMMFSTLLQQLRKPTNISITNSTFLIGIGRCSKGFSVFGCSSGGLTLSLTGESSLVPNVSILINRCKFMDNKAAHSGAVVLVCSCNTQHIDGQVVRTLAFISPSQCF